MSTKPNDAPESVPEVGAFYDPEIDGEYTPNGGDK